MSDNPMISIIVPVYNGENFIESCVNNLDNQDFEDMEICFVIDQKTKDNTVGKVEEQMTTHPNVKYIIQTDNGRLGFARNIGVNATTGKYIWFLDVDDKPFPTYVKDMVKIMNDTDSDMTFCNFYSSNTMEYPKIEGEFSVITMSGLDALKYRASGRLPVTSWSMVYKRTLIVDNDLKFKSGLAEDVDFTYRALDKSKIVSYNNKPLYLYYQNPNSICNNESENNRAYAELEVYEKLFEYFKNNNEEFYPYFKDKAIISSMRCMAHFDKEEFIKNYRTNWVRRTLVEMKKNKPFAETFIFKHLPRLYHKIVKTGMKKVYTNTMFDNTMSESHFKKWFKEYFQNI